MTQQFEKFAHQHPAEEYAKAQHPCVVTPSYRTGVIEIQEQDIPDESPMQQGRLINSVRAPWLLSAYDISFSWALTTGRILGLGDRSLTSKYAFHKTCW